MACVSLADGCGQAKVKGKCNISSDQVVLLVWPYFEQINDKGFMLHSHTLDYITLNYITAG